MGSSDVIGKTYSELKSLLSLNNVENIAVSTLGGTNLTYTNNKLNLDTTLTSLVKLSGTSNNLTINTTTNNDILFEQNNTVICKVGSTGFTCMSGKQFFGDGSQLTGITNTTYNNGDNITIDGSNNINLDTTLEDVNSIESENNTDLKLQSTGTGDIKLKANPDFSGIGKIHLSRVDNDTIRFNTIEYKNNGNGAYIKFLVHYEGGDNTLTREVLKLNSNLSAEFSGTVISK